MDLTIVDSEVLDSGNIWFTFDEPVTAAFGDDASVMYEERHADERETSDEWIIQMYSGDSTVISDETIIHPAKDKQLDLADDDRLRITTILEEGEAPTRAFAVFTASVVGVDQNS